MIFHDAEFKVGDLVRFTRHDLLEARRASVRDEARRVLAENRSNRSNCWKGWNFIQEQFPELASAWVKSDECRNGGPCTDAILAALAKLAGESEADPMPEPPEGVTVEDDSVYYDSGEGAGWIVDLCAEEAPALRFAADLAEWKQRQHARTERDRLLEAVRVAEEAYNHAWQAHRNACEALTTARAHADDTLDLADAYKQALDKAREEARKRGAL